MTVRVAGPSLPAFLLAAVALGPAGAAEPSSTTYTTSQSITQKISTETATVRVDAYSTQIIGRLNGGAPLYDQTFAAQFSDPTVQAGVADARVAITNAGGPGVVTGVPSLISRTETLQSSTSATSSTVQSQTVTDATTLLFGPDTVFTGDLGVCDSIPTARPADVGCSNTGTPVQLAAGQENFNTNTNTAQDILQTTTTTNTFLTAEVYELLGINGAAAVQPVGFVHTSTQSAAYDLGGRFLTRLTSEGASFGAPQGGFMRVSLTPGAEQSAPQAYAWFEGYALGARTSSANGRPGDDRDARGVAAGVTFAALEGFTFGVGLDHGRSSIDVKGGIEHAGLEMTQIGGFARLDSGPWFATAAAVFGFGDADTRRDLLGTARADYDAKLAGGSLEAGYRFAFDGWSVTPSAGIDYLRVKTDGFTESGPLGLTAGSHKADRTRGVFGVTLGTGFDLGGEKRLDLTLKARGVAILNGAQRTLPVAFTAAPAAGLEVRGVREGRIGAELGAAAKITVHRNLAFTAAYDGRFSSHYSSHAGRAGVTLSW